MFGNGVKVRVITYDGGIVFGEWCMVGRQGVEGDFQQVSPQSL